MWGGKAVPMRGKNTSKAPACRRKEKMCFVPGLQGTRGVKGHKDKIKGEGRGGGGRWDWLGWGGGKGRKYRQL